MFGRRRGGSFAPAFLSEGGESVRTRLATFALAVAFALSLASGAAAQAASASTSGTSIVLGRSGIDAAGEIIFQDIAILQGPPIVGPVGNAASANVTVFGADAVSLAVPESLNVTRLGGPETLTIMTTAGGDYAALGSLQGLLSRDETFSLDVGGSIQVRPEDLAPGEYRGLLVVVAQYN